MLNVNVMIVFVCNLHSNKAMRGADGRFGCGPRCDRRCDSEQARAHASNRGPVGRSSFRPVFDFLDPNIRNGESIRRRQSESESEMISRD
jgi:hypothetical protein